MLARVPGRCTRRVVWCCFESSVASAAGGSGRFLAMISPVDAPRFNPGELQI